MSGIIPQREVHQKGQKPAKVKALRDAPRNNHCKLHIPGVCRQQDEYTIGAHMRFFSVAGMAEKPDDVFIIDACDRCHDVLDHRDQWEANGLGWEDVLRAFMFTIWSRRQSGLITLAGE